MKKQIVSILTIAILLLTGCDEDTPIAPTWKNDGGAKPVSITSFYPESGDGGTVVSVFGENFGTSILDSYVNFDGVGSEVLQVRPHMVTVRVPLNLVQGDYEVNLSVRGQRVTSVMTFEVTGSEKVN
jgi:hypothetical protein